jgi:hypothetical protein
MSDISYHEMTRDEKMESWWKRHNLMMKVHPDFYISNSATIQNALLWSSFIEGQSPIALH